MNAPKGEETIFTEALLLPADKRAAFLARSTSGDAELRRRIESLLGSYGAGEFLEDAAAPQFRQKTLLVTVPLTEKAGDTIGRYKLLQQIGEGGCGVVYMAEQSEPVRRRVALKIIKLGMDTKSVIARFEAERQALAMMDHPNIAKVLDAGATETGRPYFVMELVRGMKITDYCDEKKLPMRERLDLFIHVCHAIQHAHQKGIIHRDIKPSNILVSLNDGVTVPKVIDFGIAKATTGQHLTDKTLFTAFEQFIGTPAYMSPEQAMITNMDVDTRSDIYALGVLLYEMLTGKTPFDAQELLAIGLDEMRRTIREQEPQRPSTRLSTLPGQELSTTAQRRGLEAPKLVSELRGDLDWIVMKALEKDRARRYDTANSMASDIERHLNHEPVVACPPGRLYRFRKLVRRNKLAFAAGSAVAASLVIGLTLSTVLFFRERAARERADEQTAIAEAVNDFLEKDLLRQASSYAQADRRFTPDPNLTVREALERAADRIGHRFKDRPLQEGRIRHTIGNALRDIGEAERAIPHLKRSLELSRARWGPGHRTTLDTMESLADAYHKSGKVDQSLPLYEKTLKLMKAALGPGDRSTLSTMNNLAVAYAEADKPDQALPLYENTLNLMKARLGPDDPYSLNVMNNLANAYRKAGKLDQALPLYEETLRLRIARLAPNHPDTLQSMHNLALAYKDTGKLDQALPLFEETLKLEQATLGPDHPDLVRTMGNLARAYYEANKLEQALPLYEKTVNLAKVKPGPHHPDTMDAVKNLAWAYYNAGKVEQALPLYEETLKLRTAAQGPDDPDTLSAMHDLVIAYLDADKPDKALPLAEEALKLRKTTLEPDHPDTLNAMNNLALAYRAAGKLDLALPLHEETLKLKKAKLGPDHRETLGSMNNLALVHKDSGRLDQALMLFEEALKLMKAHLKPDDAYTRTTMDNLANAYRDAGKHDLALPLREELLKLWNAKRGPDHPHTLVAMSDLALAYRDAGKLDEALPLLVETLKLRKAKLGPEDPDTLGSMNNLAVVYQDTGKLDQALPLYEETLKLQKATLGPTHSDTLRTMNNLAETYRKAGRLDQLEAMYREQLAQQSGDVLAAKIGLGRLLLEAAKTNSAGSRSREELASEGEGLVREYLADMRCRYTNDPLKLAGKLNDVAELHFRRGNYAEAAPLYREILQYRAADRSADHKDVLDATASLARVLSDWAWAERTNSQPSTINSQLPQERAHEAAQLLREVLAVRLRDSTYSWRVGDVKSRLGGALVSVAVTDSGLDANGREAKLREAESLLLDGHERVQSGATDEKYKRDALQRLVRLYEAWNKPDKRSEWQQKLERFDEVAATK